MSTPDTGDAAIAHDAVLSAKELLAERAAREEQLNLLEPVTPEDILEARQVLGPNAGNLALLTEARERKRGRPPGSRNKRTDDFKRYIMGFGQHPAITLMQIQSTAPEVLMENSKRGRVHSFKKIVTREGETETFEYAPNIVTEAMTYEAAQSLRVRCAEALMPYLESKMPVAIDMSFTGVGDLLIEGVTHTRDEIADLIEGDFMPVDDEEGRDDV